MDAGIIDEIRRNIQWLESHAKSNNIVNITSVVNKLMTQSVTLADDVVEAYAIMNRAEDAYKHALAKFVTESEDSKAKSEKQAEYKFSHLKSEWTEAKNVYKRLDTLLDRLDKICDHQKQRISVIKQTDLKHV